MNNDYDAELRRRTVQFHQALIPMQIRTTKIVKDCCFAIFAERPQREMGSRSVGAEASFRKEALVVGSNLIDTPLLNDSMNDDGWRRDPFSNRFVQFIFLEKHFDFDLPQPMLHPSEAMIVKREIRGVYDLGERGGATSLRDVITRFAPIRKSYVYGDEESAASDIATIFFNIWRFPPDSAIYLTTFGGTLQWEIDELLA